MNTSRMPVSACLLVGLLGSGAVAVSIETVPVGNPGNAADTRYASPGVGAVDYVYQMGKYEVTAGQYCEFLNAVAKTDLYGLYTSHMDSAAYVTGCNIKRTGSSGSYSYSVASDWANRPVNLASWGDAARFANWLHNGQPTTGVQNTSTTEDGSYYLNGVTTAVALMVVTRKANATWVIPSEDEWYKAAYYDAVKPGGPAYWDYPTGSDAVPSNVFDLTGTNNVNYYSGTTYPLDPAGLTIGAPYYRTEVGSLASSPSPCGTFDQGGNVIEWDEAMVYGSGRGLRGGAFESEDNSLHASFRGYGSPLRETASIGFRVAYVPEPAMLLLLVLGGLGIIRRRKA